MGEKRRSNLAGGLVLILLGLLFLAFQVWPGLRSTLNIAFTWPLIVVAVGLFLLVLGLLSGVPALAVPACIVGGVGGLLYWQNVTGRWDSWAYAWTLIPGFVGVGILLSGLLGREKQSEMRGGAWLVVISLVMFAIFASFFGAVGFPGAYWPVLLIVLGLLLLVRSFLKARR